LEELKQKKIEEMSEEERRIFNEFVMGSECKLKDLREICKLNNISTKGKKTQLQERIINFDGKENNKKVDDCVSFDQFIKNCKIEFINQNDTGNPLSIYN
jgi:hypothetical protein